MADPADPDARLSNLVHDLRSPLMVAEGFSQLLEEGDATMRPEERAEYLRRIRDACRDMRDRLDQA